MTTSAEDYQPHDKARKTEPLNALPHPYNLGGDDRAQIPVIARLVWPDRVEWRAAHVRRWTRETVLISWPPERYEGGAWVWLDAEDVRRVIEEPAEWPGR